MPDSTEDLFSPEGPFGKACQACPAHYLEALPLHACLLDSEGRLLYLNRAWIETFSQEDVTRPLTELGANFVELCGQLHSGEPDSAQELEFSLRKLLSGDLRSFDFECLLQTSKGPRWFRTLLVGAQEGWSSAAMVVQMDTTEYRRTEAELRESEGRFRLLARATSDAIWDWDLEEDKIWWSDGFESLFGFPCGEFEPIAESWIERIHPEDRKKVLQEVEEVIQGDRHHWEGEYRFAYQQGGYAQVYDRGYVLRDSRGQGVRMVGGMADITERKKLEQQFLRAQRMESLGALAGGIAHDLNNILSPILMSLEVLRDEVSSEGGKATLSLVETSARRGAELIKQILGFARGIKGEPLLINPAHIARDIQTIITDTFPKNIDLSLIIEPQLWNLHMDPTQLHQILMNLCVNARDAMPEGGRLTLALENFVLDEVYSGLNLRVEPGPYVVLRVEDSGCGMEAEVQKSIFEPFYTTKDLGQGTGLGLSTVYSIVKGLDGFINLYSEPGLGSRFKVYLPAKASFGEVQDATFAAPHLPRGRGEVILLVDDDESVREVTKNALERFGYRVLLAKHGAEGVSVFARHCQEIAVVLTDMSMPVMDGPTMVVALRSLDPDVKVIGSSGLSSNGHLVKALGSGVTHFVPKPYTAENLLTVLRRVIDEAGTQDHSPGGESAKEPGPRDMLDDALEPLVLLFVDDESSMRQMGKLILENSGYKVFLASSAREALAVLEERQGAVDLVLTDQTMPGMSGATLLRRIAEKYPEIKLILSSGDHGELVQKAKSINTKVAVITKPYSVRELQAVVLQAFTDKT